MLIKENVLDAAYAVRFLRLLTMKWTDTKAYKQGIIDKDGKLIKKNLDSSDRKVWNMFHKLAFNLKRLINKLPFGKATLSSYIAGLWLLKDHTEMDDNELAFVLREVTGIDPLKNTLQENSLFINNSNQLFEGTYKLNKNLILPISGEELVLKGSNVVVESNCDPIGDIFGTPVYKVYHTNTKNYVYVTQEELKDV